MRYMGGWSWQDYLEAPQVLVDEIVDVLGEMD